jgi:hypothetical protein
MQYFRSSFGFGRDRGLHWKRPAKRRDGGTAPAPQRKVGSQCLQEWAALIIDQAAMSAVWTSALRDIVASKPGVTQKPITRIAPNKAIRINETTIWSYALISISFKHLKKMAR